MSVRVLVVATVALFAGFAAASVEDVCSSASCSTADETAGLSLVQVQAREERLKPAGKPEPGDCTTYTVELESATYVSSDDATVVSYSVSCSRVQDYSHLTWTNMSWDSSITGDFAITSQPPSSPDSWSVGRDGQFTWDNGNNIWGVKADSGLSCPGSRTYTVSLEGKLNMCPGKYFVKAGRAELFCDVDVPCTGEMCDAISDCTIIGDPHLVTFDAQKVSLLSLLGMADPKEEDMSRASGNFWLVKSERLQMQGKFSNVDYSKAKNQNGTYMVALAMTGPALHGNVLEVQPRNGRVLWNGKEILQESQHFSAKSVSLHSTEMSALAEDKQGAAVPGLEVSLGQCSSMVVNRFGKHMDMKLSLPRSALGLSGDVQGQCGNYNGNAADDAVSFAEDASQKGLGQVAKQDLLFSN